MLFDILPFLSSTIYTKLDELTLVVKGISVAALKKNWSGSRCSSGKGATINLIFGFRCRLTIPKS